MKKTILSLIALTALTMANGYNFASVQSVEEVNATLQEAVKKIDISGNNLEIFKVNDSTSTVDLSGISPSSSFKGVSFDAPTKKLALTRGDGTAQIVNLDGAGTNINVQSASYDKPSKKITLTLTNGATVEVILVIDKGDIGLGNVDNTSDADKPIPTSVATELAKKKVVDLNMNSNDEIIVTFSDGTTKTL